MAASNPAPPNPADDPAAGLTAEELDTYGWQLDVAGFGPAGQRRLRDASVLVTRVGGLGGIVATELAAAGIGRLVLAHGGLLRPSDLNRQTLMSHAGLGQPRVTQAAERLRALNPRLAIEVVDRNVDAENVRDLVARADLVVDCAPLFSERYLLNREAVAQGKPMVEVAVYDLELHLTLIVPGRTPCLRCLYPEPSTTWTRRFPVFGAVAATAGGLAALEAIKWIAGFGTPLAGRFLRMDLRSHQVTTVQIRRLPGCPDCSNS